MEFRILGPLEVVSNGEALDLGGQKQRALLAVLVLNANEVVSSDRLIEALWQDEPPDTAQKAVQVYVSQLRKLLGRERLETRPPGYLLRVDEGELDLARFRTLRAEERPHEALSIWRGPPLGDFAYRQFAQAEIARLQEQRLACLEERVERDLAAGLHADLAGELETQVAEHPLRERFRGQLMLALYRSGRQAEALEVYQAGRRMLVDELGLEPEETLKSLERSILEHDPGLDLPIRGEDRIEADVATTAPRADVAAPRQSRKTVTALFVELVIADGLETLDPEAHRRIIHDAVGEVRAVVEHHGGTVETLAGDAVMAVFGIPAVHEDDALRAVRAAIETRDSLMTLASELAVERGLELRIRLGVSTGEVVTGGGAGAEFRAMGAPLTLAPRLAGVEGIVADDATYRRVGAAVIARPEGAAWRISNVADAFAAPGSRFDSPMVGRGRERRRLHDAFEQALDGRSCQLFTVLGLAGVGKSRLVQEFLGGLGAQALVVHGRCLSYGEGITYFPLMEAVKEAAGLEDSDSPDQGLDKLVALLQDERDPRVVARRVGELVGLVEVGAGGGESFTAVRTLFEALARRTPLVIVFDDIHWGEETFLDLVEHLAGWIREAPVLLVCVARPELLDVRSGWAGGMPNATTVLLEPLSEEESARLLDNLVGEAGLDETVRRRIVEAAEGNPLFVEEMLALATEDGGADGGLEVPPTIQALLAARLDRLGEDERAVVEYAAVEGKVFYENAVCEQAPEVLRPRTAAALGSLLRKELIRPDRPGLGSRTYRFRHLLICDAAYDSIPKQARGKLHEDFAAWLERATRGRGAEYEEVVGYHFEQAYRYRTELEPLDDAARELGRRAAERLGAAGRRALVRSDAPAGVNLISRAVATLRPDDPLRVELVPNVRSIQGMSGDLSWADRALTEAVEAAATSGDRRLAAHALVQRGLLRLFTESDVTSEELLDAAGRAIVVFEEFGDELGLARAWRLVAQAHYLAQRGAASAAAAEEALARIRRIGDPFEEREIVEWLLVVQQLGPMPIAAAIDRSRSLLADAGSDRLLRVIVLSTLAVFEASLGHSEDAAKLVAEARQALDEHGDLIPVCFWCWAWVRILNGDLEGAEADLRAGYEALRTLGRTGHFSSQCVLLAHVSYRLGRHDNAERYAKEAQAASRANDVHTWTSVRAIQARLLAARGEFEHAERLARAAVDYAAEGDFLPVHADALIGLAQVLRLADRSAEAATPLEEAVGLLEQKGDIVSAARTRALLAELGTAAPDE